MSMDESQKRLDDLENLVTELHNSLPTVVNSRMQNQIADPHLERIADALVLITTELRDLSAEVHDGGTITGGGIPIPY